MRSNQRIPDPLGGKRKRIRTPVEIGEPILSDVFSVERLEQHAHTLAAAQTITASPRHGHRIQPRVADNGRVLVQSYRSLAQAIKDERAITPAAEWLIAEPW